MTNLAYYIIQNCHVPLNMGNMDFNNNNCLQVEVVPYLREHYLLSKTSAEQTNVARLEMFVTITCFSPFHRRIYFVMHLFSNIFFLYRTK